MPPAPQSTCTASRAICSKKKWATPVWRLSIWRNAFRWRFNGCATPMELADRTVGVIGSGIDEHDDLARPVGRLLATLGVNLLTGGGQGVMNAVSRAFTQSRRSRGICIGIIPCV